MILRLVQAAFVLSVPMAVAAAERFVPDDVDWRNPVYETSFEQAAVLKDWVLEGGKSMNVREGNLVLESSHKDDHLVAWLNKEMPADFMLEFSMRPKNRTNGLNIVFFNTRGVNGESIFAPSLRPRNGIFRQYHSSDLNSYHFSYWSGERAAAHLRKNKGFHLVTKGEDLIASAPAGSFQTIRIYKRGGRIRLMVDDSVSIAFDDDGKTYGPVHTHPGWIGLRQMGHTELCEYGSLKIYPLTGR